MLTYRLLILGRLILQTLAIGHGQELNHGVLKGMELKVILM